MPHQDRVVYTIPCALEEDNKWRCCLGKSTRVRKAGTADLPNSLSTFSLSKTEAPILLVVGRINFLEKITAVETIGTATKGLFKAVQIVEENLFQFQLVPLYHLEEKTDGEGRSHLL